jgi:hypothetical protein
LLNEARENLEKIIDMLHEPQKGNEKKPRTYRKRARRDFLNFSKNRKPNKKSIRKAIRKQLGYVKRDLAIVETMLQETEENQLPRFWKERYETIQTLYVQQNKMYQEKNHQIDNRIVSLNQPHVRPIVRGKSPPMQTEFGAKIAASMVNGYSFLEQISWDNFNEGTTFRDSVERYFQRFGCYPEAVIADGIYRNRENLSYCKDQGIRLTGPALGRKRAVQAKEEKKQQREDSKIRNSIEGKFGEGKRFYGLDRIMAHRDDTSESVIALQFIVMNLEKKLRLLFAHFLHRVLCIRIAVIDTA